MAQSDLDLLLEMGFEKARADLAVKKTGGRKYLTCPILPTIHLSFPFTVTSELSTLT
jgi:hypothetical protein